MKRVVCIFSLLVVGVIVSGQDVVHLKTGESAACTVTAITDNIITYTLPTIRGSRGGSAKRTLQMDRVSHVEWGFRPGEETAWENRDTASVEAAEKWWNEWFASIHRPRARTAGWGIAFGNALLRANRGDPIREPFPFSIGLSSEPGPKMMLLPQSKGGCER
jgi:hypothetical protein